jgi:heat shock protein HtpX
MALAKRVVLFLILNFVVVAFISFILWLFNIQPFLTQQGLDLTSLAIFCLIWGMGGSFISLFLSKWMAKWSMGVQVIDPNTQDPALKSLLLTVYQLADKAGLPKMPEVGIYKSPEVNAFATGPSKSNALVAVSTGLLNRMDQGQVEGVLGHEVTHIANGDMVTMTLLQGVINAFVMFLARAIAFVLSRFISGSRDDERQGTSSLMYFGIVFVLEMVFMLLGSLVVAAFSRYREFRADAGGARLSSPDKMISALQGLKKVYEIKDERTDQPAFQAFKISSPGGFMKLLSSHPPLDDRISRLKTLYRA